MKRVLIILLLTITTVLPTFATHWTEVGNTHYIDTDSIKPYVDDRGKAYSDKYFYMAKRVNDGIKFKYVEDKLGKNVGYSLAKEIVDLKRNAISSKRVIVYDTDGNVIYDYEQKDRKLEWHNIKPDSVGDCIVRVVKHVVHK